MSDDIYIDRRPLAQLTADTVSGGGGGGSVTLTGAVTGTGTGTVSTSIADNAVTTAKIADAELKAIAGLTSAADKGIQFTGDGTAATFDLTTAGKALLDDANAAAQRTTLGLGGAAVLAVGTASGDVAAGNRGVTGGDTHDHAGGDGAQIDHAGLANVGTNTHGQIDTHVASTSNPHSVTASQVGAYTTGAADTLLAAKAPLASPTLTGTPAAPTAAPGTNTTQLATTAFVAAAVTGGSVADGDKGDVVVSSSGTVWSFDTGVVTAAAKTVLDDTTTGAMLTTLGAAAASHTHAESDVTNLVSDLGAKAPLASPTFTGTPAAPTAAPGTNTTQVATTAFVVAGSQPLDATLTALAGLDSAAGLVEETGADAFTKRALGVGASTSIPTRADADARYAAIANGVTGGDSHDHNGGDGAQIAHTALSSIGTNTHGQIDTHLAASNPHSGSQPLDATLTALAGLDTTTGLVEETATDTFTKRALGVGASTSVLTRADGDGRYASISGGSASLGGLAYANTSVPGGNTVAGTASETAFTSSYTIPGATLAAGDVIRVMLSGIYGTTIVAPTLTGKVKLGSTVMLSTGAVTTIAAVTNGGWTGYADIVVQSAGASGALEAQGFVEFSTAATTALTVNLKNTAPITVDTTADQALTVTVQWGTSDAANTITLRNIAIQILRAGSSTVTGIATVQEEGTPLTQRTMLNFVGSGFTAVDDAINGRTNVSLDAELNALGSVTSAADKVPYFTGSGTASVADFSSAGRALVDDADASAQRTTLGLGTISTQSAASVTITGGSITGITDLAIADGGTAASTAVAASDNISTKSTDIASATTTDLSTATGTLVDVTGTVTITGFGTVASGAQRMVRFTGALTLTHNATSLILPGAANITTANGDRAILRSLGSGNWLCVSYTKASGVPTSGTNSGDQTITLTGDVTGSGTGSFAATVANDAVTYAKIQNVSATDKVLGRSTAGSGDVEEIACTSAGRALIDDVDATAQRTTLGLGTAATQAASSTPTTSTIPIGGTNGVLATGWLASGTADENSVPLGTATPSWGDPPDLAWKRVHMAILPTPGATTLTVVGLNAAPTAAGSTVASSDNNDGPFISYTANSGTSAAVVAASFNIVRRGWDPDFADVVVMGGLISGMRTWHGWSSASLDAVQDPTTQAVAAFRYDTGASDTTWRCITCDAASGVTNTSSGITVVLATQYRFRITIRGTTIKFYINDALVATTTTNLPPIGTTLGYVARNTGIGANRTVSVGPIVMSYSLG